MNTGSKLAQVLQAAREMARPGTTLQAIENAVRTWLADADLVPENPQVLGFRHAASFGLNAIIGGIQNLEVQIADEDLLTIDVAARDASGYIVDASVTCRAGSQRSGDLGTLAEEATLAGVAAVQPGRGPRDVLDAISAFLEGKDAVLAPMPFLHGIGASLHVDPCAGTEEPGDARFLVGDVLAIEPVLLARPGRLTWDVTGWEVSAANGADTAFVEHTVVVIEEGAQISTLGPRHG
ncbi:M24 family metallopeptidase [Roseibium sp. AS2]|uniref:M24 family metallopeptidase n=1 Tax=Roseibium sp. AS2 TaxID=3135781 RepID=UPI00317F508B